MFVYALISKKDGRIYVGMTQNLSKRLQEHNSGKTQSTRPYRPWHILHYKKVENRLEARAYEKKWKSGSGKEYLKTLKTKKMLKWSHACLPAGRFESWRGHQF